MGHGLGRTDEIDVNMLHAPANDPAQGNATVCRPWGCGGAAFG